MMHIFGPISGVFAIVILAIALCVYFLPSVIAFGRGHHQRVAILVLNLLLGWTALGWIVALIWSFTAIRHDFA